MLQFLSFVLGDFFTDASPIRFDGMNITLKVIILFSWLNVRKYTIHGSYGDFLRSTITIKNCFSVATVSANKSKVLICGHAFHARCIGAWQNRRGANTNTCPLCRHSIS